MLHVRVKTTIPLQFTAKRWSNKANLCVTVGLLKLAYIVCIFLDVT